MAKPEIGADRPVAVAELDVDGRGEPRPGGDLQLGADGVFVGSGIFKSDNPSVRAKAIVEATTHFKDPAILAKVSRGLGPAMPGLEIGSLEQTFADRGW